MANLTDNKSPWLGHIGLEVENYIKRMVGHAVFSIENDVDGDTRQFKITNGAGGSIWLDVPNATPDIAGFLSAEDKRKIDDIGKRAGIDIRGFVSLDTELPVKPEAGWAYIIKESGNYAGIECKAGNLLVYHDGWEEVVDTELSLILGSLGRRISDALRDNPYSRVLPFDGVLPFGQVEEKAVQTSSCEVYLVNGNRFAFHPVSGGSLSMLRLYANCTTGAEPQDANGDDITMRDLYAASCLFWNRSDKTLWLRMLDGSVICVADGMLLDHDLVLFPVSATITSSAGTLVERDGREKTTSLSISVKRKGLDVPITGMIVTRNGAELVSLDNVPIENRKERFALRAQAQFGTRKVDIETSLVIDYIGSCLYGCGGADIDLPAGLEKMPVALKPKADITVTSTENFYLWYCAPEEMPVISVTSSGFAVPMNTPVTKTLDGVGVYRCYRSANLIAPGTHDFNII